MIAAARLTTLLADPTWRPSRAHIEQARNELLKLGADLATAELRANGGCLDAEQAAAFMRPILLDGALFAASWERMILLATLDRLAGGEETAHAAVRTAQRFCVDVWRSWRDDARFGRKPTDSLPGVER